MVYLLQIDVDEEKVKAAANMEDLDSAVHNELNWVASSGIAVIDLKRLEP